MKLINSAETNILNNIREMFQEAAEKYLGQTSEEDCEKSKKIAKECVQRLLKQILEENE